MNLMLQRAKYRKKLKMKLEMAKFLQDTVEEISLQKKGAQSEKVHEFKQFMEKVGINSVNDKTWRIGVVWIEYFVNFFFFFFFFENSGP